jgi:glyoxylase-like metal-dependent hydrolase (beta-lactamase superfamily II)
VDAQDASGVDRADSALRTVTTRPVRTIINTHYHFDHVTGNPHFRAAGVEIIAHENVPIQAQKDTTVPEMNGWHRTPAPPEALPTRTIRDSLRLRIGHERVLVRHFGPAHTDGDLVIFLERANVVHIGDILEREAPAFIDWWAGGSLDGMIAVSDSVLASINDSTKVVPGHGTVTNRAGLRAHRDMLVALRDRTREVIARGGTYTDVVTTDYDAMVGGPRGGRRLAYILFVGLSRDSARGGGGR